MRVLYMTHVTNDGASYVTHGHPFELRRPIGAQEHDAVAYRSETIKTRSWIVSASVPHECDVLRCASEARARRAWTRVSTALVSYTFLVRRLNADLARTVLVLSL